MQGERVRLGDLSPEMAEAALEVLSLNEATRLARSIQPLRPGQQLYAVTLGDDGDKAQFLCDDGYVALWLSPLMAGDVAAKSGGKVLPHIAVWWAAWAAQEDVDLLVKRADGSAGVMIAGIVAQLSADDNEPGGLD